MMWGGLPEVDARTVHTRKGSLYLKHCRIATPDPILSRAPKNNNAFAGRAPPEKASEISDAPVSLSKVG